MAAIVKLFGWLSVIIGIVSVIIGIVSFLDGGPFFSRWAGLLPLTSKDSRPDESSRRKTCFGKVQLHSF
jgi:hypothetical protein